GPFTDNGDAPDQDIVAFVQGAGSMSQIVGGLTAGATYHLTYAINARGCCSPGPTHYSVSFDGAELLSEDIQAVGGANPFAFKSVDFTPGSTEGELRFSHQPPDGDRTLLLDNIQICSGPDCRPAPHASVGYDSATSTTRIAWDSQYFDYRLQAKASLGTGAWADVTFPVVVEGNEQVVYDDVTGASARFYRLAK